jgi:hypothetical protein
MSEFASETHAAVATIAAPIGMPIESGGAGLRTWAIAATVALIVASLVTVPRLLSLGAAPGSGTVRVESEPAGAEVRVDGVVHGRTPLSLNLAAGSHTVELAHAALTHRGEVRVTSGAQAIHHVVWAGAAGAPGAASGSLQIVTVPVQAAIEVDGVARGVAPVSMSLGDLAGGDHQIVIRVDDGVRGGAAAATAGAAPSDATLGAGSGWLEVAAALPLQILENGRVIGTTEAARTMLPVGRHNLAFVAADYGFRTQRTVDIGRGRTTVLTVALDRVPLSINATPWAEVFLNGTRIGETPLAGVLTTIGLHQVEFRHPELGRRTVPVRVTLQQPARISVDMRTQ